MKRELPDRIEFMIPRATKLINRLSGRQWTVIKDERQTIFAELFKASWRFAIPVPHPMERARVTVSRFSVGIVPDTDNLYYSCKPLLDALIMPTLKRPGLGFIVDDSPAHIELRAYAFHVNTRSQIRTEVIIERLPS